MTDANPLSDLQVIVLAALLHDIGKFAQRAAVPLTETTFGREDVGRHGAHALHSMQFVQQELHRHLRACGWPILRHHNPGRDDWPARAVAAGDRLSAGERQTDEEVTDAFLQPMTSSLATIYSEPDQVRRRGPTFALKCLDPADEEALFPKPREWDRQQQERDYHTLWRGFLAEHRRLDQSRYEAYLAGLYSLLERYTWCIPSAAYRSIPDVSLFDHARVSAAIAAALCQYREEAPDLDPLDLGDRDAFLMVVGDLSGIQSYLYEITHGDTPAQGVARRLRARSLYLHLVTEMAARKLVESTSLPFLNIIMHSGGHFHGLLPNTERARKAVADLQAWADRWMLSRFGGELALNLASVSFGAEGFQVAEQSASAGERERRANGFGLVLRHASQALGERKLARLREALQSDGAWREEAFLLPSFAGEGPCQGCGKESRLPGVELGAQCAADLELGRRLTEARYLAVYEGGHQGVVRVLDRVVQPLRQPGEAAGGAELLVSLDRFEPEATRTAPTLWRPLCNYVPTWRREDAGAAGEREGTIVSFEDLADRAHGRKLLGFLKADVDHLGEIFVFGFRPNRDTPSRLAQTSRLLDLFFSGWLPSLLQRQFPDCYSVYAGGDDLLIVGPWDQTLALARAVSQGFARLTQNEKVHLSAGLFLAKPGYPIARAAQAAGEALERAKSGGRNRLCLLGHVLTWEEWDEVRAVWLDLTPEAEQVSTAFLYHLLQYGRMWRRYVERGDVLALCFQPLLAYDVARNLPKDSATRFRRLAEGIVDVRPSDLATHRVLRRLELLAQLLILRQGAGLTDQTAPD